MKKLVSNGVALVLAIGAAMGFAVAASATSKPAYTLEPLAGGLEYPWALAFMPDGGFLISEKTGYLHRLDAKGATVARSAAPLPGLLSAAQGGLLDLALLPHFAESGQLLLSYACGELKASSTCLARAVYKNDRLEQIEQIFRAQPDRPAPAHFGGRIALLPDQTLVLTLGDGFDLREQAQNPANHLGKLVRLQWDGRVPQDNPFVGRAGYAPEIYSLGHRNVQGIVWDAQQQRLLSHEHGPRGGDELNVIIPGANYGWPVATHGTDYTFARISPYTQFAGMQAPLHYWTPSIAPAGMTLYRGDEFPDWQGNIFIAALAAKRLHRLVLKGEKVIEEELLLAERNQRLRDVRSGPDGAIYVLTDSATGELLRLRHSHSD